MEKQTEVCIVGLGAAGSMAAYMLTRAGVDVVALEAGPKRVGNEHAMDELQSSGFRNAWGTSKFNHEVPTWRRNARSLRRRTPVYWLMANGTGGSSSVYGGVSFRYHPDDFLVRTNTVARYGAESLPPGTDITDWPLSYQDLEPYYGFAEELLGVSGEAGNLRGDLQPGGNPFEGPRQHPYPLPPLRMGGIGELFREAACHAGYHPFPVPAAILSQPHAGRSACTYCSFCTNHACHVGAKGSASLTVLPRALSTGRLTIRTGCRALRVLTNDRGQATGVEYLGPDGIGVQAATIVMLATYTFENVRLLLVSRSPRSPNGLGNNSGQVGRCYMARQYPAVAGILDGRRLNRFTGPFAQCQTIDDLNADNFDHTGMGFIRGGRIAAVNQMPPIGSSGQLPPDVPRWGRSYKQFLAADYNSILTLGVNAETLPYEANELDLDPDMRDPAGVPLIRITFDIYDNERRTLSFLQERAVRLLGNMGASRIWRNSLFTGVISAHDGGGTRMGTNPSRSVVDGFGQLHEVPNVFVLGGSTFPTLGGLNPTLTLQALALRSADYAARRLRRAPTGPSLG